MFAALVRDEEIREFEKQIGPTIEEDSVFLASVMEPPDPTDPFSSVIRPEAIRGERREAAAPRAREAVH